MTSGMDPNEAYDEDLGENAFFLLFKVHPHPRTHMSASFARRPLGMWNETLDENRI